MSVLNLDKLFRPESVALIGASDQAGTVGSVVMRNLRAGGFRGAVLPVNPSHSKVCGELAYPEVAALPLAPDLGVICTPAATVPDIITQLGTRGTRAAVVMSAGLDRAVDGQTLEQKMLNAAMPYGLRILGPNCVGLLVPGIGLNASFAHTDSLPGKLAFLSQSGALCTTVLDWARSRGIGFSSFVSLGNGADVDIGDLLDFFGSDSATNGILLYMESVRNARKFLSAARASARNKKIIAIKSGRFEVGARAAATHTGAMAGRDEVFDAAFRRAGILRVHTIEELFDAAETLAHARPVPGRRLAILTNGGGPGVLAVDHLAALGGVPAELAPATLAALDQCLPPTWSRSNPVDIIGDADAARYARALRILLEDPNYDAILVMLVPTALIDNEEVARSLTLEIQNVERPVLACWMGEGAVAAARRLFAESGVPAYETPASAVRAFLQMVDYEDARHSLMQTPASVPENFRPQEAPVRAIIRGALGAGRAVLTEPEAKSVLSSYGIPIVETRIAATVEEAASHADELQYPVALKILSSDITHKREAGGVLLDIGSREVLLTAAQGMLARVAARDPKAAIQGLTVQKMVHRPGAQELIIGVSLDPIFGPVILFGQGGSLVEAIGDTAIGLPPLNMALAGQLVARTRIHRVLAGGRGIAPADVNAILLTLVKVSQLVVDHPEIAELDINPLLADGSGVMALDARIRVVSTAQSGSERIAIRPYPRELEETVRLGDVEILIRPIRPEDEPAHRDFVSRSSSEDLYFRFFRAVHDLSHEQLARFTQIDYDREMALIATRRGSLGQPETLGVVRAVANADNTEAEFAVIVRSDWHGRGLGRALMERIIRYCRSRGTRRLVGQTLVNNEAMRRLAQLFSFCSRTNPDTRLVELELSLQAD